MKGWIQCGLGSTHLPQRPADLPPSSPSLVTRPKNFNLHGLSVVVKYNTDGAGLVYPGAMKLLSEEIDTHTTEGERSAAAGKDLSRDGTSNGNTPV